MWDIFGKCFFKYCSCLFSLCFSSRASIMDMLFCLLVSHRSLRLFPFSYYFFFLLLRLKKLDCPIFTFTDYLFCLFKSGVSPSSKVFISVIVLFSSRISVWFLFIISILLLIFSFCSYIIFLILLDLCLGFPLVL